MFKISFGSLQKRLESLNEKAEEKHINLQALIGFFLVIIFLSATSFTFAQFNRRTGTAGYGYGYGYGYGIGYGWDSGSTGYRISGGSSSTYEYGYGYGYLIASDSYNSSSGQYEITGGDVQTLVTAGVLSPTGSSMASTTAVRFGTKTQITVGSTTITIPANTTLTAAQITSFAGLSATSTVVTSGLPSTVAAVGTMQFGLSSLGLTLDQDITVNMFVGTTFNGLPVIVYKKSPGGSWTVLTTCTVVGGYCQFTTNTLSDFAGTRPAETGGGTGGSVSSGGGGGGGGGWPVVWPPAGSTPSQTGMSVEQLRTTLMTLIAQLKVLLQQAKAAGIKLPPGTEKYLVSFDRDLDMGAKGEDVKMLQQFLNSKGFVMAKIGAGSPGNETTYFGGLTKAALAKYQASVGIRPASGYLGPITRAYLKKMGY